MLLRWAAAGLLPSSVLRQLLQVEVRAAASLQRAPSALVGAPRGMVRSRVIPNDRSLSAHGTWGRENGIGDSS